MISFALLFLSLLERLPGPEIGQMSSRTCVVSPDQGCPSNSALRTTFLTSRYDRSDQFGVTRIFLVSASLVSPAEEYHSSLVKAKKVLRSEKE